ncbi:MAG TPA: hypothetical protein VD997_10065 [Phycisphaerales bacterium]|nr:hypothetical protein [Phycisphaerales bacterium]
MTAVPFKPQQPVPLAPAVSGRKRRSKVLLTTAVTLFAATAILVVLNVVSDKYNARLDVTATGTQKLSPRTTRVLGRLESPVRVVVATDLKSVDARARERVRDVLGEMKRSSGKLDFALIDTGSASGFESYKRLLRELVARDQRLIDQQVASVNLGLTAAQAMATYLNNELSPALQSVQGTIAGAGEQADNNRAYFEQAAAAARLLSQDMGTAVAKAGEQLKQRIDDISLPAADAAARTVGEALARCVDQLTAMSREIRRFAEIPAMAGPPATAARNLLPALERQRDDMSVLLTSMRGTKRLDLIRIADVLRSQSAALVIGSSEMGITAIDLESLMPSAAWLDATGTGKADLNRRVEEVVTTGIGSLLTPVRPIVVMVHAERPFFEAGQTLDRNFGVAFQRLRFHGIDVIEWSVITEAAPSRLAALNPDGKRPVVYMTFPPDSADGSEATGSTGAQRSTRLAQVVSDIAAARKNLLISLVPSVMPTYGQSDPMAPVLARFGLMADTGRPLLAEAITPEGRLVQSDHIVLPEETTGALAGAVRGLPMIVPWAVSFHSAPTAPNVTQSVWPLYSIMPSDRVWAESQWLQLWQTPRPQRGLMPNPPAFDNARDARNPQGAKGEREDAWLVAVSVEQRESGKPEPQRLVAVGSREWILNPHLQQRVVDGRIGAATPGNLELLEASVFWLSGQDELIAQSATAQVVSLVQPMEEKVLSGLRTTMILGLPLLVLACGVVYRLIRG